MNWNDPTELQRKKQFGVFYLNKKQDNIKKQFGKRKKTENTVFIS